MSSPPWTELPEELLAAIAKRLNAEPEILRFRAVCKSWRSSTSLKESSPFPLKLPFPISTKDPVNPLRKGFFTLSQTSTYLIRPLERQVESPYRSLLIRVRRGSRGKSFILNPFSRNKIIGFPPKAFPKLVNLLDYNVTEVGRSYSIEFNDRSRNKLPPIFKRYYFLPAEEQAWKEAAAARVKRVVVSQHPDQQQCLLFGIYNEGNLFLMKSNENKWITLDDGSNDSTFEDVAVYKGKCYAVDTSGTGVVLNSSLEILEIIESPVTITTPSILTTTLTRCNHLVESFGDLLFIFGDLDPPWDLGDDLLFLKYDTESKTYVVPGDVGGRTLRFNVYKLNEECREWNRVNLKDRALFLGEDCRFSVMAKDSTGCRSNCIYYNHVLHQYFPHKSATSNKEGLLCSQIGVYNLDDGVGGPIDCFRNYTDIFWPPPAWLRPNLPSTGDEAKCLDEDQTTDPFDLSFLFVQD